MPNQTQESIKFIALKVCPNIGGLGLSNVRSYKKNCIFDVVKLFFCLSQNKTEEVQERA